MNKNRIYIPVIIFLLVTNIATIATTIIQNRRKIERDKPVIELPVETRMGFLRDELGLDAEQQTSFTRITSEYNEAAAAIAVNLAGLRSDMLEEMTSSRFSSKAMDDLLYEFGQDHIELKRLTMNYYNNLSSICDSMQLERLNFMFRDMLDPNGIMYGRGRGGQGRGMGIRRGRGQGRGPGRGYGR